MLIGLASLRGAPGASSLAVALAATWERRDRTILVELDPDGGTFAARYGLSIEEVNLAGLAAASRHHVDEEAVWRHTQESPFGIPMIVAPSTPAEMNRIMRGFARRVGDMGTTLDEIGVDVFCDLGRLRPDALVAEAASAMDVIVLVTKPTFDQLEPLLRRLPELLVMAPVAVVLAGHGPYRAADVDAELREQSQDRAWVLGEVPEDRRGARLLTAESGGSRRLHRSAFWRSSRKLSRTLAASVSDDDRIEPGSRLVAVDDLPDADPDIDTAFDDTALDDTALDDAAFDDAAPDDGEIHA